MKLKVLWLTSALEFRLRLGEEAFLELNSLGVSLLNPLYYPLLPPTPFGAYGIQLPVELPDRSVMLGSRALVIADSDRELDLDAVNRFLRRLRHASAQALLASEVAVTVCFEFDVSGTPDPPRMRPPAMTANGYHHRTAITWEHLRSADVDAGDTRVDTFIEIYLDAVRATFEGDPRRSILFAAIAAESMASHQIQRAYAEALASRRDDATIRVRSARTHDGEAVRDPVFERLAGGESNFLLLFHELPLYLLGRSIQTDTADLWKRLRRLHATRNKLAHVGAPSGDTDREFSFSALDVDVALKTAAEAFEWFGIPALHMFPDHKPVHIGPSESGA